MKKVRILGFRGFSKGTFLKTLKSEKAFTLTEVLFVAIITVAIVGAILAVWVFTSQTWTKESTYTELRIDLVKALETMRSEMALSSLTGMSFYPSGAGPYTAMSFPVAKTDANGFFSMNDNDEIEWDGTVIYHLYTELDGSKSLRRTEDPARDNDLSDEERFDELEAVALAGLGEEGMTTDPEFLTNIDDFVISSLAPTTDFYTDSATPVRVGKVVFGWVKLDAGEHVFRFEIMGKNALSSGYEIGIDRVMIEPSGSAREMEYYMSSQAPVGMLELSSGVTSTRVHDDIWGNNNYFELDAAAIGDYMEITDSYDLWRESSFDNSALNNTVFSGEENRVELCVPDEGISGDVNWYSHVQAGDAQQQGRDGYVNPANPASEAGSMVVIRTIISDIDIDPNLTEDAAHYIRVKFAAASSGDLRIDRCYITRRDAGFGGFANSSTAGLEPEEFHTHQQLFFRDEATGDVVSGIVIPQGEDVWTLWTAFPLIVEDGSGNRIDYFVTYHIPDTAVSACKYWEGSIGSVNSYYAEVDAGEENLAGTPAWSVDENTSKDIFAVAEVASWRKTGFVESHIFDTTVSAPEYNQIKWSEELPLGTEVSLKARSSANEYMTGAYDWSAITGSSVNPHDVTIGDGRYVQFRADLSAEPFWETAGDVLSYADYIDDQVNNYAVYEFPVGSGGDPYVTKVNAPWVDDIEIDWPGTERIVCITGYIAKKNSYGQAKLTVDGKDLDKVLSVYAKVMKTARDTEIAEENYIEVRPRNTGK